MEKSSTDFLVLISAGAEWRALLTLLPDIKVSQTPFGEYFITDVLENPVIFLHGGWGKVATAGATQYAIDRWNPKLLLNLGTCGGLAGKVERDTLILAEETVIYDIIEGMSSYQKAIDHYTSKAELGWLGESLPFPVKRTALYSADRDIRPEEASGILADLGAAAGDWESGAFAWICARNQKDWLVIRGITDLVSATDGEALGNVNLWWQRTMPVMARLVEQLPWLLNQYQKTH
ncbi:MAG: 5'-methylthioadenosine/S-adenosylhomocysteine nucleosidase [Anaerolineaceae bacterium]